MQGNAVEVQSSLDATLRAAVFEGFLGHGSAPSVEELMGRFRRPREEIEASLDRLDTARHLKLVPGTHRVLMAFPFSAVATPYRVSVGARTYYANCAWDAIAFHPMLRTDIQVTSFCHHCGDPISFAIDKNQVVNSKGESPVVYLGLPAADWWKDIVFTCSNTMLFFASAEHLRSWRQAHPEARGAELSIDQMIRLSEPIYAGKLELEYARPSRDRMVELFQELHLTGDFWKI